MKKEKEIIRTTIRRAQLALVAVFIIGMLMGIMGGYVIGIKCATSMYNKTIEVIREGV